MASQTKASDTPVVMLENVCFSYNGPLVLEDVSFQVHTGEMVFIVGPNGGGKTTLLRLILGLLRPDSGQVKVFDKAPIQVRSRFGYVPQHVHFDDKFPVSVMDVVLMGRIGSARFGFFSKKDTDAAEQALNEVGMLDVRKRAFSSLSGGQRQRVLVARALTIHPEVLLLDEPTAYVDSMAVDDFYSLLETLNERLTILNVSHDLSIVSRMASSVVCVNRFAVNRPLHEMSDSVITEVWGRSASVMHHGENCPIGGHAHES